MRNDNPNSPLTALVVIVLVIEVLSLAEIYNLNSYVMSGHTANTTKAPQPGYITISATGTASAQPATGTLYVSVKGMGKSAAAATSNLSAELDQLNSSISKYVNGNTSLIQTTYYAVSNQSYAYPVGVAQPSYPYYPTYNGFVAEQDLAITLPNIKNMSNAIGSMSLINNTEVTSANADLSDSQITALRYAAFSSALQNATSQASILTGNATLSAQNITVSAYNFYPIPYALGAAGSSQGINSSTAPNPSFYSGTASVTESITVVFSYNK